MKGAVYQRGSKWYCRRVRLHGLRNTSVSLMLDQGNPPHIVAGWHGHDPAVALSIYSDVKADELRAVGASLFRRASWPTGPASRPLGTLDTWQAPSTVRGRPEKCVDLHKHWWARTVSNRRPLVCKTRALPLSYAPQARRRLHAHRPSTQNIPALSSP